MRFLSALLKFGLVTMVVALVTVNLIEYGVLLTGVVVGADPIDVRAAAASGAGQTGGGQARPALTAADRAEMDDSSDLPGRFVPSQGRAHLPAYPLPRHMPFCDADRIEKSCYASNPPTSGSHLPVQGTVKLEDGHKLKIPPDPDIYDFAVPREAIPHIQEHAGVYVGYNCTSDDCASTVERLKDLVAQELSLGAKVVMSPDPDLDGDTIGLASWTRVDTFAAADYSDERARDFIKAHSCRFDPERFCTSTAIN
ncbi:MAG: DUF3105 domain-containing protein [Chloroflexi bacterium]|nr:DUF3105 domain-containing protein [Chloroflexota bacterium]